MPEQPDFERVLAEHRIHGFNGIETSCSCSPRIWRNESAHRAHLAAALNAEVARWLADEGTRERVAQAFGQEGASRALGSTVPEWHASLAATALAALAPTDTTAAEGGAR